MKRFLLSSVLLLAMARTAFCDFAYVNNGIVQMPPGTMIDATNFVNNGSFSVDMTSIIDLLGGDQHFTTSSTQNYTNNGVINAIPGIDFENFPVSAGVAKPAANFVNQANGLGGGAINVTNLFGGLNIFSGGLFGITFVGGSIVVGFPINFDEPVGLAKLKVRADNVVDSGSITMDNSGLIDILGNDLDLRRGQFTMTGVSSGVQILQQAFGFTTDTNLFAWNPLGELSPPFATSPPSPPTLNTPLGLNTIQMSLDNATFYFQSLNPQPDPVITNLIVWRIIALQDNSPTNVTKTVYFGNDGFLGAGAFHIEWSGGYRDPLTGGPASDFFYLNDEPGDQYTTNGYFLLGVQNEYSFQESPTKLTGLPPANPGFTTTPLVANVTNNFAFINVQPTAVLVDTNIVVGGSPTNLPGRIQLTSKNSMNLANTHISGPTYLSLNSPVNFLGNSNSLIAAPYADVNFGTTSGSMTISNLLVPLLPAWSGVRGAPSAVFGAPMGGVQAYSATYTFVDANGFTNDVRILMVNSAIQPSAAALQKDMTLNAANSLVISDALHIYNSFSSDTTTLTVTTNANSAYSLSGEISLLSPDIFWSASLPNLQFLTNWGVISSQNLMNFAGNMLSPGSDPAGATPYQAFVNHGLVANQGAFIRANYFANSGTIQEGAGGGMDISAPTVIGTNSLFIATNGPVTIAGGDLFISNSVIQAGQALTFTPSCSLSDGYVFGNQFGHITNATLPNVVTNGNIWTVNGGVRITAKPATADLLGTTITNMATNSIDSINEWVGEDRGVSPSGFADNLALGRMILKADANPSQFTFIGVGGNNALYVDSIEFQGSATNTDAAGNLTAVGIQPGMKIYYAQALINGVSVAEKLNGKNGGGFLWVSNYAGIYSSTNIPYPDGNTYIFNEALAISPDLDSDGDTVVNVNDPTPIPAGLTFDISVTGPQPCGGTNSPGGGGSDGSGGGATGGSHHTPGILAFPTEQSGSGSTGVSFAGSYSGLFYETNGVNPASSGFFTAKVTSRGNFSAKLQLGAKTYSFSGLFTPSGNCTVPVGGKKGLALLKVELHLVNNDEIVGNVSSGNDWSAQLMAVNKAPAAGVGKHSLVLSANTDNSTTASGDSFGTMTLSKSGDIQWTGVLPDGAKISQKSALSKGGVWPLYSSLYGGSGSLLGWMQLTNGNTDIGGSAVWIVPAKQNALYPNGLTNELDATGSSVTSSSALSHSTVILSGPDMAAPLTKSVNISGKTGQSEDKSLTLSVDAKNGLFNGSVTENGQTLSFQGALLEKSGIGGGFFLNANKDQGGKVYLAPAD